jgi:hypothetical protein
VIRVGTFVRVGFSFGHRRFGVMVDAFLTNRAAKPVKPAILRTLREEKSWLLGKTSYLKQLALDLSRALLLQKEER